jgi:hypothetical protein
MTKKLLTGSLIIIFIFILYCYRLPQSLSVNTDYAKDVYAIAKMSQGHFTLLGPALSAGIFAGPYYYYLMLPGLVLSGLNPYSLALTGALLFFYRWVWCTGYLFKNIHSSNQSWQRSLLASRHFL